MKTSLLVSVAAAGVLAASQASAALIADFQLNGDLVNAAGGAVTLTNNGADQTATGLDFDANEGPTLNNLGTLEVYDLETRFSLDVTSGYRKIVDFFNRGSDTGLYVNGGLHFYPVVNAGSIAAATLVTVRLTRDADDLLTGYINGSAVWNFTDAGSLAVINNTLHLFRDDFNTGQSEASGGFVDYVRLSTPGGGVVPEPATWALMIGGFGLAGTALRRRRSVLA